MKAHASRSRGIGCFYLWLMGVIGIPALIGLYVAGPLTGVLVAVAVAVLLFAFWWYVTFTNWKGVPPLQFTLLNNLTTDAVVIRVQPPPSLTYTLQPGERTTFRESDPMYQGIRSLPMSGPSLLLGVVDPAGRPIGQVLLTNRFLSGSAGFTICLSAAAAPPYIVDGTLDVYNSCPKPYPG